MRHSDTIAEIAKALNKAQRALKAPKKDKKGQEGHRDYMYSDLASLIEAIREPFAENGLSHVQPVRVEDGYMVLETYILHESGEWLASDFILKVYDSPKAQGSALTYVRRYALGAFAGVAPTDDDDGTLASQHEPEKPKPRPPSNGNGKTITRAEAEKLFEAANESWSELHLKSDEATATLLRLASRVAGRPIERLSQFPAAALKDLYAEVNQFPTKEA